MKRSHRSASPEKRTRLATLFLLGSLLVVSLVLYGSFLASADANTSRLPAVDPSSEETAPTVCCSDEEEDNKPHLLAASYYSVKKNLSAKLLLNNKGPNTLEVRPTLFSLSGLRYDVYPIMVESNSFQMIDMREWIDAAGTHFQEGSIQVFHLGRDLVLGSQVYLEDERRSLSYDEKLVEPAGFRSSRLQGLWWLPSPKGEVLLAISNTSNLPVTVQAKGDGTKPTQKASVTVELGPHETRLLDVEHDIFGDNHGAMSRFGALSIEHNGQSGAVIARGMAQDAAQGYSLPIQFLDPSASKSTKLQGAGLRLKEADHEALEPVVVVHNAGSLETTIKGRLPYRKSDGRTAIVPLPDVRLSPGETTTINVAKALKASRVPDDVTAASLEFEYTNDPGSVLILALSVSDSGNQLFRLPLWDIAAQRSATGGYPWYIDGTSSTYVYLKNVTDTPQQYTFQLDFADGVYSLGLKTVEPRQAVTVDIRALRDEQTPDARGNRIPLTTTRGQVIWSVRGPDVLAMIGRSEQVDTQLAVSNNYACQNCCGNTLDNVGVNPQSGATIAVGNVTMFEAWEQDKTCYGQLLTPYTVTNASWSSSNTSVATVSGGIVSGQGPGGAGITASWDAYVRYFQGGQYGGTCHVVTVPVNPGASINVVSVKILKDGIDITGTSRDVIVGQEMNLVLQVAGSSASQIQWSVPNNPIADYVANVTSGTVVPFTNTRASAVSFYWIDGGNGRQVSVSCTVNGLQFTKTATFDVRRPVGTISAITHANATVDSALGFPALRFGNANVPGQDGINFSYSASGYSPFTGIFQWVQLADATRTRTSPGGTQQRHAFGLDTYYPGQNFDGPYQSFDVPYTQYSVNDTFSTYLLFKPTGVTGNSIWVPLRKVDWSWGGTATLSNGVWVGSGLFNSTNPPHVDAPTHPVWTTNVLNSDWQ